MWIYRSRKEANTCIDHIYILIKIPPKINVSSFMRYLKGKSLLTIFDNYANLKYKYRNRHFGVKEILYKYSGTE